MGTEQVLTPNRSTQPAPKFASQQNTTLIESPAVQRAFSLDGSSSPPPVTPQTIPYLQSAIGNQAVQRILSGGGPSGVQGSGAQGGVTDSDIEGRIKRSQGSGSALPDQVRNILQPKLQADLKNVKVHTDSNAVQLSRDLNAQAFTYKNHIFYGKGKSPNDLQLTAHEAVHTIQQGAVARRAISIADGGKENDSGKEMKEIGKTPGAPFTIQRLTTAAQLEGTAGTAKKDWSIGKLTVRRMSTKYKAILTALRRYENILNERVGGDIHGYTNGGAWDLRAGLHLDDVEDAINQYLAAHEGDTRSAEILKVKQEIPKERVLLEYIGAHSDDYADMTGREALRRADADRIVNISMTQARQNQAKFGDGDRGEKLKNIVTGVDDEAMESVKGQVNTAKKAWGMNEGQVGDAFRGSDDLSVASAEYAKGNFLNYYMSTVMPAFERVIRALRGSGIGTMKDSGGLGGVETYSDDITIYEKISSIYEPFVQTVFRALPQPLINAAIAVYARIRKSTSTDNEAFSKKLALAAATNTIYVRCFGPALNTMSGVIRGELELGEMQALTSIIQLVAKQGPGVSLSMKDNEYSRLGQQAGVQRAAAEYQRILDQIVLGGEQFAARL